MVCTYEHFKSLLTGRNATSRRLTHNTYLRLVDDGGGALAIRLHNTDILVYHPDGRVEFHDGGWKTHTTKDRMGEFSRCRLSSDKGVWTIRADGASAVYADGIVWNPDKSNFEGNVGVDPKVVAKLVREIKRFTTDYMNAFKAGRVDAPGAGDCWHCLMLDKTDGKTKLDGLHQCTTPVSLPQGPTDHLYTHMDEKYYVPSLLVNAIARFPISQAAYSVLHGWWSGTREERLGRRLLGTAGGGSNSFTDIAHDRLQKSLYRYMKERLGVVS